MEAIILHTLIFFLISLGTGLGIQFMIIGHVPTDKLFLDSLMPSLCISGYLLLVDGNTFFGYINSTTKALGGGLVMGVFTKLIAVMFKAIHKKDPLSVGSVILKKVNTQVGDVVEQISKLPDNAENSDTESGKEEEKLQD